MLPSVTVMKYSEQNNLGVEEVYLSLQVPVHLRGKSEKELKQQLKQKPWKDSAYWFSYWLTLS